jgi:hypothetical protein
LKSYWIETLRMAVVKLRHVLVWHLDPPFH